MEDGDAEEDLSSQSKYVIRNVILNLKVSTIGGGEPREEHNVTHTEVSGRSQVLVLLTKLREEVDFFVLVEGEVPVSN